MTIEKGEDWGSVIAVDPATPVVDSDAGLADLFSARETVEGQFELVGPEVVALVPNTARPASPRQASNGLARTVGARGSAEVILGSERTVLPMDLGIATIDPTGMKETTVVVASSLVICGRFWSGVTEGAMNAAFLDEWNVTPSGHPNDGRFDVVRFELGLSDRLKAKKLMISGSHVPHPNIDIRRLKHAEFAPSPSQRVWIDGRPHGHAAKVVLHVLPDAVSVAI